MSRKSAKFATAVAVGIIAGLAVTAGPRTARAADECLTEPKGPAPQGKHWHYHTERGTQRHCWYLRGEDDTAASTTAQDQSAATDDGTSATQDQIATETDQAPPAKPPAKRLTKQVEPPAMRSIADARAELPAKARVDDASAPPPAVAPRPPATVASAARNAPDASVWPDPQAALAAKPVVDASSSDAETDAQPDMAASVAPEPSPVAVSQATPSGDRQIGDRHRGSIPMLLLVAFGALALAGLTGSTVYRLASIRRRVRPEDRWSRNVKLQAAPARQRLRRARPEPIHDNFVQGDFQQDDFEQDDFEQANFEQDHFEPEHLAQEPVQQPRFEPRPEAPRTQARTRSEPRLEVPHSHAQARASDSNNKREQIEAYLAQLTRQLQADLEARAE